eukprot:GEMP01067134.1.p1 GENE.GEMP01067134.1~~GEMP01067134.1.p1  ORF type:complete len:147 (+),score=39.65 GEMP01067134.1:49-489(+)
MVSYMLFYLPLAAAWCGTHGGGKRMCVNDPFYTCTDCGWDPCVDIHKKCWSCAAVDKRCYPYHCYHYCSTKPCNGTSTDAVVKPTMEDYSPDSDELYDPPPEEADNPHQRQNAEETVEDGGEEETFEDEGEEETFEDEGEEIEQIV